MKPSRLFLAGVTLALALLFTFAVPIALAGPPKEPPPPPDTRKLIKSVDAAAGTIVIQNMRDKSIHTYKIDDLTTLTVNNVPGKIADIKPGMEVGDYLERYSDTLDSLTLHGYGTEPAVKKTPAAKPAPKKPATPKPTPSTRSTNAPSSTPPSP